MPKTNALDRRRFFALCSALGLGSTVFPSTLLALAEEKGEITRDTLAQAATVAGLHFDPAQEEMMLAGVKDSLDGYDQIRKLGMGNGVAPAVRFDPVLPGMKFESARRPLRLSTAAPLAAPKDLEEAAFFSVRQLGELVRTRKVSSLALTQMYLGRLKRYDPSLLFTVTLTEERALAQAKEADRDLARGHYRGPLHGLPWGAKDLLATKGYRTTWGAGGFEDQYVDEDATVVQRLDAAGAVLVAKLTLGALAMGDQWYFGMTRNPWKLDQGSSGSSAGPASATAAGCVAFSIGSETLGSIASPSTRCGCTGLRPTFGRVPRSGAMALSWTMDKLGPIGRAVEDCALVLAAIAGPDGHDLTVHDLPFNWDATLDVSRLRVGYLKSDFERAPDPAAKPEDKARRLEWQKFDDDALDVLRSKLGIKLVPVELPKMPWDAMVTMLLAEAAAAFDGLTRSGRDRLLTAQGADDWPNLFRVARLTPAVEYVQAARARTLAMQGMAELFRKLDVLVAPTFSTQLVATNLTGHPALILPDGFRTDGTPVSLTFVGNLYGEAQLCALARAYQQATGWHRKHPKLEALPAPPPPAKT